MAWGRARAGAAQGRTVARWAWAWARPRSARARSGQARAGEGGARAFKGESKRGGHECKYKVQEAFRGEAVMERGTSEKR